MDKLKLEYIRGKRKKLFMAFAVTAFFGLILFAVSKYNEYEEDLDNVESVDEGGITELYRKMVGEEIEAAEAVSKNVLDEPVNVRYRIENDKLFVMSGFYLSGEKIVSPSFRLKKHGHIIFSESFESENEGIHCKGVMEEGSDRFFIYYCSKE